MIRLSCVCLYDVYVRHLLLPRIMMKILIRFSYLVRLCAHVLLLVAFVAHHRLHSFEPLSSSHAFDNRTSRLPPARPPHPLLLLVLCLFRFSILPTRAAATAAPSSSSALLVDDWLVIAILAMLHVAHTFSTQEKPTGSSKRGRWPELALLRWISPDGHRFMWERLPFYPPSWRTTAATQATQASCQSWSPSPSSSSATLHREDHRRDSPFQQNYAGEEDEDDDDDDEDHDDIDDPPQTSVTIGEELRDHDNDSRTVVSSGTSAAVSSSESSGSGVQKNDKIAEEDDESVEMRGGNGDEAVQDRNDMDGRIWSSLPEDIVEKVLAWLPLTSVLRFRAVCRRWNSVLLSGSFLTSHARSASLRDRQPCFLLCTIGRLACTYDPALGRWLTLLKPTSPGASVIASTGSLFCLGNQVAECRELCVCNPITRCLRRLPPMLRLRLIHKITMLEDRGSNSYIILVAGEDGLPTPTPHNFNLITEVFDSRSAAWRAARDPPPDAKFGSDPGVWFDGAFYCLTELPYGLVRFRLQEGVWEEVTVAMPHSLSVPSLVTARNRLLMVGRCKSRPDPAHGACTTATTIRIWELVRRSTSKDEAAISCKREDEDVEQIKEEEKQHDGGLTTVQVDMPSMMRKVIIAGNDEFLYDWVEVMEMPSGVRERFLAPLASYSPFVCAGVGSSIFMTTHLSPKVLVLHLAMAASPATSSCTSGSCEIRTSAAVTAASSCWSWLPQDPLFPIHRDFHLVGFSFEPRFDAFP